MIFYIIANVLKLNFFSGWTVLNKHSFTIILGTFLWSILWQFTRLYTGDSIVLRAIHSGFYYLVLADLYTFLMMSSTLYNSNVHNNNFHDLNYYGTLEMQPFRSSNTNPLTTQNTMINDVKQEEVHIDNNITLSNDDTVSEVSDHQIEDKKET